jgi:hypothetical protein
MTARQRLSTKCRAELLTRERSTCHLCLGPVLIGQRWEVSHPIPLALGGPDDETNRSVAHWKCHKVQTATIDMPAIGKARRVRSRHTGAAVSHSPMRGGRHDILKRKMNGTVVMRATGQPWRPGARIARGY